MAGALAALPAATTSPAGTSAIAGARRTAPTYQRAEGSTPPARSGRYDHRSMAVDTSDCCPTGLAEHVDRRRAEAVAQVAKLLADPVRVALVELLRGHRGAVCQCELAPLFDVSQPTLSHHLARLEQAGLVTVERRGRWAYYAIDEAGLHELREWLA